MFGAPLLITISVTEVGMIPQLQFEPTFHALLVVPVQVLVLVIVTCVAVVVSEQPPEVVSLLNQVGVLNATEV
jgi:hypothetical protein